MYNKKENLTKEKINLEIEDTKETKIIQFLGGKLSIYLLIVVILTFLAIWLYKQISGIVEPIKIIFNVLIAPVLIAYVFFYILRPVAKLLTSKMKVSSSLASILAIVFGIASIFGVFTGVIPVMVQQTQQLITAIPGHINVVRSYLEANADNTIVRYIIDYINNNLNVNQISSTAFNIFSDFVSNAASILSSMATIIVTAPFVLYYLLKDSGRFRNYVISHLPSKSRKLIDTTVTEIDEKVGSYISGQMLVSLCIGILLFIGYKIIGLEYAISLATIAAVLSIVPYLGPMLAILPAMLVAISTSWLMAVKIIVVWGIVQFLEGNFISPNIMGRSMQQHPLTVIFVILIATNTFGIVGAIVGIPVYAILKILGEKLVTIIKNRYHRIFDGEEVNEKEE